MIDEKLRTPFVALRWTYGLVPLLAGLDKFFNLLADWSGYLSPAVANLLPVAPTTFMYFVGVVEMAVGVMVLTRWTKYGAYLAAAWLTAIAANLVVAGSLDIAVRDLAMAVGAYTLARLAALQELAVATERPRVAAQSLT
ncbi:MAG: DoxX family membrane protein [Vicinamibacteria bacterium]